jgi:2'-deoxynucleoside 5'-phosphate N-hydrolase
MKIYFAGSIRGGRNDKEFYLRLILYLQQHGDVLTEHVGNQGLTFIGDDGPTDEWIYDRDMAWLKATDVVVAEVSTPSLGVGYEIAKAEGLGKPILCLWRNDSNKRLSAMIGGSRHIKKEAYDTFEQAIGAIDRFFGTLG